MSTNKANSAPNSLSDLEAKDLIVKLMVKAKGNRRNVFVTILRLDITLKEKDLLVEYLDTFPFGIVGAERAENLYGGI